MAVIALVGVVLTALVTYSETRRRLLSDLAHDYDLALRNNRVEVYPKLRALTETLPRYGTQRPLAVDDLLQLTNRLRHWYFETGGMFLSGEARDAYFDLQTALADALRDREPEDEVSADERERLREIGSTLRTKLSADVRTREAAELSRAR